MRRLVPLAWRLGGCLAACGCGYHAAYAGGAGAGLHVAVTRVVVADALVAQEVAAGVREELARAGALEPGDGYPRAEIEVLRADEASQGIARGDTGPAARGLEMAVLARARVVSRPGEPPEDDTGDIRADESVAVDETSSGALDPRAHLFRADDARRAAARRLGRKLGLRLLGQPVASEAVAEPP